MNPKLRKYSSFLVLAMMTALAAAQNATVEATNAVPNLVNDNNATKNTGAKGQLLSSDVTTNGGTTNAIPLFATSTDIENSILSQSGTSGIDVAGSLAATGSVSGSSFKIGSKLFDFGNYANANAFLGFAGNKTMTGQGNTAAGVQALANNTTGTWNTASGWQALGDNTTGGGNTATGTDALAHNTTGYADTASGYYALVNNTTGAANTADGNQALQLNTIGENNTASGFQALTSNNGGGNTASGAQALAYNTTGNYNTAVGLVAGNTPDGSAVTGSENTFLGVATVIGNGTLTNASAIGALAEVTRSNSMVLGSINGVNYATSDTFVGIATTAPTNIFTIGQGHGQALADGWATYSSRRWKTNIQTLPDALAKVEKLRGVSYDLKDSGKHEVGVIAEEVGAVVPEVVTFEANGKDARGVDYSRLTALLIEAVKEQQKQIAGQEKQNKAQQKQITELQSQLQQRTVKEAALERRLTQVERNGTRTEKLTAAYKTTSNNAGQ